MANFKASFCLAVGYLIFYAGISNGGRYATRPWDALTQ
jgi:hypothetical protein